MMSIYSMNPVTDSRWQRFIDRHPQASVFHTTGWLQALARTYDYEPVVHTTSPEGKELTSAQPFCRIDSWITGKRLVSLPFSDHTALLLENRNDFLEMAEFLQSAIHSKQFKYVEVRPLTAPGGGTGPFALSKSFYLHRLPLTASLDSLFKSFHPSCVQRKVRKAEREKLEYVEGRSEKLIGQFYRLLVYSRRRFGLPPQPIAWFRNLASCLESNFTVRIASRNGVPTSGIVTLAYKKTMVYKYGCSDPRFNNLGGTALVFWKAIQDAKNQGLEEFDLGRSDIDDVGLINYKEHWGATRQLLTYFRYPAPVLKPKGESWQVRIARKVCGIIPAPALVRAGTFLYKHAG